MYWKQRVWREQWQSSFELHLGDHRKVWGFAKVVDHIQMYKLIKAAGDKMSFHKVLGSSTGGDPESKFGNKVAAHPQSGWRFSVNVKNLPEQMLPIMERESVLQHLTQCVENCQRGLSGTDHMWWVNTKNSIYKHCHLFNSWKTSEIMWIIVSKNILNC